jgi:hypothetical protein
MSNTALVFSLAGNALMSLEGLSRVDAEARVQAMGGTAATPATRTNGPSSTVAARLVPSLQEVMRYDLLHQRWRGYGVDTEGIWGLV